MRTVQPGEVVVGPYDPAERQAADMDAANVRLYNQARDVGYGHEFAMQWARWNRKQRRDFLRSQRAK